MKHFVLFIALFSIFFCGSRLTGASAGPSSEELIKQTIRDHWPLPADKEAADQVKLRDPVVFIRLLQSKIDGKPVDSYLPSDQRNAIKAYYEHKKHLTHATVQNCIISLLNTAHADTNTNLMSATLSLMKSAMERDTVEAIVTPLRKAKIVKLGAIRSSNRTYTQLAQRAADLNKLSGSSGDDDVVVAMPAPAPSTRADAQQRRGWKECCCECISRVFCKNRNHRRTGAVYRRVSTRDTESGSGAATSGASAAQANTTDRISGECIICSEKHTKWYGASCGHPIGVECVKNLTSKICPICRMPLTKSMRQSSQRTRRKRRSAALKAHPYV